MGEGSIGRYLARQRELRGISLEELSNRTKIPVRSLARLEAGAFDQKPDGFARGFVRTVAGALGLDADEAVTRLLAEPVPETTHAGLPGRVALLGALLLAAALLAGLLLWRRTEAPAPAPGAAGPSAGEEWVLRPDAVRSLAVGGAQAPGTAAPAAKPPPPPQTGPPPP